MSLKQPIKIKGLNSAKGFMVYLKKEKKNVIITGTFSVVRVFAHGAMGRGIKPSWVDPFFVPASAP